jgi:hypothetical protein
MTTITTTTTFIDARALHAIDQPPDEQELIDQLLATESRHAAPFGLYVIDSSEPAAELARSVERSVFLEYFGNTPEMLRAEYDAYEPASTFLAVIDHRRRRVAGMIRVIRPSASGVKSLDDIERVWRASVDVLVRDGGPGHGAPDAIDIATLAVCPEYRGDATGGLISLALYQAVTMLAGANGMRWLIAVLDLIVLDLIQSQTSSPFTPYPGLAPMGYLDSPSSLPVFSDLHEYAGRLATLDPSMFEILFEGTGLEAAVSQPSSFQLADRIVLAAAG